MLFFLSVIYNLSFVTPFFNLTYCFHFWFMYWETAGYTNANSGYVNKNRSLKCSYYMYYCPFIQTINASNIILRLPVSVIIITAYYLHGSLYTYLLFIYILSSLSVQRDNKNLIHSYITYLFVSVYRIFCNVCPSSVIVTRRVYDKSIHIYIKRYCSSYYTPLILMILLEYNSFIRYKNDTNKS